MKERTLEFTALFNLLLAARCGPKPLPIASYRKVVNACIIETTEALTILEGHFAGGANASTTGGKTRTAGKG